MSSGPLLYPEGPEELHTGTPRSRNGLLLLIFGGAVVVAVAMILIRVVVKGPPDEQAQQAVGVFLAALDKGDTATAHETLCAAERQRLKADQIADAYLGAPPGRVGGAQEAEVDGDPVYRVQVRWDDGSASRFTVVGENGPHVCGVTPGA